MNLGTPNYWTVLCFKKYKPKVTKNTSVRKTLMFLIGMVNLFRCRKNALGFVSVSVRDRKSLTTLTNGFNASRVAIQIAPWSIRPLPTNNTTVRLKRTQADPNSYLKWNNNYLYIKRQCKKVFFVLNRTLLLNHQINMLLRPTYWDPATAF